MPTYLYKITPVRSGFADSPTDAEIEAMSQHFSYLKRLLAEGTLFLAGPCTDAAFGIVIFDAGSLEEAQTITAADPAVVAGVVSVELHEFRISLIRNLISTRVPNE